MAANRLRHALAQLARPPATYTNAISLAGGATVETLTVPGSAGERYVGIFGYTAGGCFVKVADAVAAWTPGDTTDGSAFSCAPAALELIAGQVISLQNPNACVVCIDFYLAAGDRGKVQTV